MAEPQRDGSRLMRVSDELHSRLRVVSKADKRTMTAELDVIVEAGLKALGWDPAQVDAIAEADEELARAQAV